MKLTAWNVDEATDAEIQQEIDDIFTTCDSIDHLQYIAAERVRMCSRLVARIRRGKYDNIVFKGKSIWIGTEQMGLTIVTPTSALDCPWKVIATPVSNKGDKRWTA